MRTEPLPPHPSPCSCGPLHLESPCLEDACCSPIFLKASWGLWFTFPRPCHDFPSCHLVLLVTSVIAPFTFPPAHVRLSLQGSARFGYAEGRGGACSEGHRRGKG